MLTWLRSLLGRTDAPKRLPTDTSPRGTYSRLRNQALSLRRADAGVADPPPDAPAWGVLMETGYPGATATLFTLSDGTASLYVSSGGGVIGGQAHETVRQAVAAFIQTTNRFLRSMTQTETFPLPGLGRTIFYVLTDSGVLSASAAEDDLGKGGHALSELFRAAHAVISELRIFSQSQLSK